MTVPVPGLAPGLAPVSVPPPLRGGAARAALVATAVTGPSMVAAAVFTYGNGASSDAGRTGLVLTFGGLLLWQVGLLVSGILVLVWLDRAGRATGAFAGGHVSRGLLLGGWFVPVGALWLPVREVSRLVRVSGSGARVGVWWGTWLVGAPLPLLGLVLASSLSRAAGGMRAPIVLLVLVVELAGVACLTTSALSLGRIMRGVSEAVAARAAGPVVPAGRVVPIGPAGPVGPVASGPVGQGPVAPGPAGPGPAGQPIVR